MKTSLLFSAFAVCAATVCAATACVAQTAPAPKSVANAATAPARPNIVFIFADDLGWKDVGYQGSDFYETPNIDALAKSGMVFSNAYAAAANCAPSRACLMSGQYTPRHGVYAVGDTERGPKNQMRLVPIANRNGLPAINATMAEALKDQGYATGMFGKWHLDGQDGAPPDKQGFDTYYDSVGAGISQSEIHGNKSGPSDDPKGVFTLTHLAGEWMEKNKNRPFFCYLSHHAIHVPLQERNESLQRFKAKQKGPQQGNAKYAAMIYDFDESVGQLVKKLKDLGLERNTLLVFTSDNGASQNSSQEPLRGSKGGYYEGGIREPMIVRWPGVIADGTRCDVPVSNIDFYPTFLDVAKGKAQAGKITDGESLLPLFGGATQLNRRSIFWHFPGYLNKSVNRGRDPLFRTRPVSVIRKGDWKLLLYHEEWQLDGGRAKLATNHAVELYNLANDIGERTDLSNQNTPKRDELLNDLLKWFADVKAPLPTQANSNYDPTARPKKGRGNKADAEVDNEE